MIAEVQGYLTDLHSRTCAEVISLDEGLAPGPMGLLSTCSTLDLLDTLFVLYLPLQLAPP